MLVQPGPRGEHVRISPGDFHRLNQRVPQVVRIAVVERHDGSRRCDAYRRLDHAVARRARTKRLRHRRCDHARDEDIEVPLHKRREVDAVDVRALWVARVEDAHRVNRHQAGARDDVERAGDPRRVAHLEQLVRVAQAEEELRRVHLLEPKLAVILDGDRASAVDVAVAQDLREIRVVGADVEARVAALQPGPRVRQPPEFPVDTIIVPSLDGSPEHVPRRADGEASPHLVEQRGGLDWGGCRSVWRHERLLRRNRLIAFPKPAPHWRNTSVV